MSDERRISQGRVWMQFRKFEAFKLILLGGLNDSTITRGALNPSRRPSRTKRGEEEISDILRSSPDLPGFTLTTRLQKARNYVLGIKCAVATQVHIGDCDRPDNYRSAQLIVHWNRCYQEDGNIPQLTKIEGDDAKVEITTPFKAIEGPIFNDMLKFFLSARTITEAGDITDMAFLGVECIEDCGNQADAGENGYAVSDAYAGSPSDVAGVYSTGDKGNNWTATSATPFNAGETISAVMVSGIVDNHRVWVFRGSTDAGNPAELAYADVTVLGTTVWNYVNIGSVNGQYVTAAFYLDDQNIFVGTDDGYIYKSDDSGATWTAIYTTAAVQINDIQGLTDGTLWVVGATNTLLWSTDAEATAPTFTVVTGPSVGNALLTCEVTADGTLYIGDDAGNTYGSTNDGVTYTGLQLQGVTAVSVDKIRAINDDILFAICHLADGSSRCLLSVDGATNFRLWELNMPSNSGLNALVPINENLVFVGGDAHPVAGNAFISRTQSNFTGL